MSACYPQARAKSARRLPRMSRASPRQRLDMRSVLSQHCLGFDGQGNVCNAVIEELQRKHYFAACLQNTKPFHIERVDGSSHWLIGTAPRPQLAEYATAGAGAASGVEGVGAEEHTAQQKAHAKAHDKAQRAARIAARQGSVCTILSAEAHAAWQAAGAERHADLGPRVMAIRLSVLDSLTKSPCGLFLVCAFAPKWSKSDDDDTAEWDAYYAALATAISRKRPDDILVIGTSANASIGTCNTPAIEAAAREAKQAASAERAAARQQRDGQGSLPAPADIDDGAGQAVAVQLTHADTSTRADTTIAHRAVGPYGLEHVSAAGLRLLGFMQVHNVRLNTRYP